MDMRKNWEKCTLAAIFAVVSVLYLIALIDAGISFESLGPVAIATFIFLLGLTVYFALEHTEMDISKWVLLCVGAINVILIIIAFINVSDLALSLNTLTEILFVPLAVYALLPLILGIKKVLNKAA